MDHDYEPTVKDLIRCRVPISGVEEANFFVSKEKPVRLVNLRSSPKVLMMFDGVEYLFFVVALNEYANLEAAAWEVPSLTIPVGGTKFNKVPDQFTQR